MGNNVVPAITPAGGLSSLIPAGSRKVVAGSSGGGGGQYTVSDITSADVIAIGPASLRGAYLWDKVNNTTGAVILGARCFTQDDTNPGFGKLNYLYPYDGTTSGPLLGRGQDSTSADPVPLAGGWSPVYLPAGYGLFVGVGSGAYQLWCWALVQKVTSQPPGVPNVLDLSWTTSTQNAGASGSKVWAWGPTAGANPRIERISDGATLKTLFDRTTNSYNTTAPVHFGTGAGGGVPFIVPSTARMAGGYFLYEDL